MYEVTKKLYTYEEELFDIFNPQYYKNKYNENYLGIARNFRIYKDISKSDFIIKLRLWTVYAEYDLSDFHFLKKVNMN